MKATSVFAIAALALAGTACSQAADEAKTVEMTSAEVTQASAEPEGSFNLNLGLEEDDTSGGLNLNLGGSDEDTGLIGEGVLSSGSAFAEEDDLSLSLPADDLAIDTDLESAGEAATTSEDDGLIRLPN